MDELKKRQYCGFYSFIEFRRMDYPNKVNNPGYIVNAENDDGFLNTCFYNPEGDLGKPSLDFTPNKGYFQGCFVTIGSFQVSFKNTGQYFNIYPPEDPPTINRELNWKSSELANLINWIPNANPATYFPIGWSVIFPEHPDKVFTHDRV